MDEEDEIS